MAKKLELQTVRTTNENSNVRSIFTFDCVMGTLEIVDFFLFTKQTFKYSMDNYTVKAFIEYIAEDMVKKLAWEKSR